MKVRATIACCPIQLGSISSLRCQKSRNLLSIQTSKMRSDVSRTIQVHDQSMIKPSGGARRDRTDDLMLAKHALSQLSYGPVTRRRSASQKSGVALRAMPDTLRIVLRGDATRSQRRSVVGLGRLELPTSRLSSARSNQLSYKPLTHIPSRTRDPAHTGPARVRPRRKRNVDGEIPPMQLNDPDDRWPLMFLKRSDSELEAR